MIGSLASWKITYVEVKSLGRPGSSEVNSEITRPNLWMNWIRKRFYKQPWFSLYTFLYQDNQSISPAARATYVNQHIKQKYG